MAMARRLRFILWAVNWFPVAPICPIYKRITHTQFTATHAAVSVPLDQQQIEQIAVREGWQTLLGNRGPFFQVVEFWVENRVLLELLTPKMAEQYKDFSTPQNWEQLVLAAPLPSV
jgi:hypothetical protein